LLRLLLDLLLDPLDLLDLGRHRGHVARRQEGRGLLDPLLRLLNRLLLLPHGDRGLLDHFLGLRGLLGIARRLGLLDLLDRRLADDLRLGDLLLDLHGGNGGGHHLGRGLGLGLGHRIGVGLHEDLGGLLNDLQGLHLRHRGVDRLLLLGQGGVFVGLLRLLGDGVGLLEVLVNLALLGRRDAGVLEEAPDNVADDGGLSAVHVEEGLHPLGIESEIGVRPPQAGDGRGRLEVILGLGGPGFEPELTGIAGETPGVLRGLEERPPGLLPFLDHGLGIGLHLENRAVIEGYLGLPLFGEELIAVVQCQAGSGDVGDVTRLINDHGTLDAGDLGDGGLGAAGRKGDHQGDQGHGEER